MCGRYVLALRPRDVCSALQKDGINFSKATDNNSSDTPRLTYNLAPSDSGLVFLGYKDRKEKDGKLHSDEENISLQEGIASNKIEKHRETRYELQTMKWGLIPSWTKRTPDSSTISKTINCRDDSLAENKNIWNSMKNNKRCIVIAQGYYEWLKGKEKIPHYIKRKDGKLLCFAGLFDCVRFNGQGEKLYTYTVITTDSSNQLKFLHHRMPVILENGSQEIYTWLDPDRKAWSTDLQNLLRPFAGELEIYPVGREVGKVGNDSPSFIVPVTSCENKSNIANFFSKSVNKDDLKPFPSKAPKILKDSTIESTDALYKNFPEKSATNEKYDVERSDGFNLKDIDYTAYLHVSNNSCEANRKRAFDDSTNDEHWDRKNTIPPELSPRIKSATSNNTPRPLIYKKQKSHHKITDFFKN